MAVEHYKISVPGDQIERLHAKLKLATFPDELDDAEWSMGAPLADIKRLTQYWQDEFNWRKQESDLNELPHFQTNIDVRSFETLNIHFVHQKSASANALPLLFSHGWPGSFLEVRKLLPMLTTGTTTDDVTFHVVAPSLPNYGFSQGTKKRGFGIKQYAEVCHKLMIKLGYTQYVTQGGDWGFHVTRAMGLLYPGHCKASHLNVAEAFPPSISEHPLLALQHMITPYSAHERAGLMRTNYHATEGRGYEIVQNTKPQTVGYALTDSPVALLAWIYEKLHEWADDYPWTDDEILTWVSLYWFSTAGPAASCRIYYEIQHVNADGITYERLMRYIPHVKYGIAHFPKDLTVLPNTWAATLGDVVLQTRSPHGGHFAAVEHPEIIARDLRTMFGKGGKAHGCVQGLHGS